MDLQFNMEWKIIPKDRYSWLLMEIILNNKQRTTLLRSPYMKDEVPDGALIIYDEFFLDNLLKERRERL